MLRALPFVVEFALLVYALIDCVQSEEGQIRSLPRVGWILLIIFVPIAGPIAWLVAGRPIGPGRAPVAWPATRTAGFPEHERPRRSIAPDDNPEFLSGLGGADPEREDLLRQWEAQLREREQRLTTDPPTSTTDGGPNPVS